MAIFTQRGKPVADRQGLGMTLLFLHALKIMRDEPLDQPSSASRKDVAAVRKQCATMARILRAQASLFLELPDQSDREDARKFEAVALRLDQLAVKHCVRDRGNTLTRYITGDLVKTCRVIFGSSMYRTVATITRSAFSWFESYQAASASL